jgi:hypothetical protein
MGMKPSDAPPTAAEVVTELRRELHARGHVYPTQIALKKLDTVTARRRNACLTVAIKTFERLAAEEKAAAEAAATKGRLL